MVHKLKYASIYTARAEKDIVDSFTWYEQQQKGLGDRFIDAVKHKINKLNKTLSYLPLNINLTAKQVLQLFPS